MSLVLDASLTLAGLYPDKHTPPVHAVMDRVAVHGAVVPSLWRLEVANILKLGIRRGRNTKQFRDAALVDLERLPIEIDDQTDLHAWCTTLHLADIHNITLYDAAYLELPSAAAFPSPPSTAISAPPQPPKASPCSASSHPDRRNLHLPFISLKHPSA